MALLILILIAGGYLLAAGTFASAGLERWATIAFYTSVAMVFAGAYLLIANWMVL